MKKKHECAEKEIHGSNMDDIEYDEAEKEWRLHLDCHCCSTTILICPYCGKRLTTA